MKSYLRSFVADVLENLEELATERNYFSVGLVILSVPLLLLAYLLADLVEFFDP